MYTVSNVCIYYALIYNMHVYIDASIKSYLKIVSIPFCMAVIFETLYHWYM